MIDLLRPQVRLRAGLAPYVVAVTAFALYATWSVTLHRAFQTTGFDLGIFEQGVRSYAEGHWPVSDLVAPRFPLLGDHFHPVLALLAPWYALWPSPVTLLVAQAAMLALSVVPVTRCAQRAAGPARGTAIGIGYALSWGLLSAVSFDFHEVAFAVPLLAFTAERLLLRQWTAALAFAVPLVLVKEDLPLTLAAVGGYLVLQGQRRLGWATAVFGVLTTIALVTVVLPALSGTGTYVHASGNAFDPLAGLPSKAATLVLVFAPTAFTALRSPISLLLLPTLAWRTLSGNPAYWGPNFHYSAVLMPVVFVAAADGLARAGQARRWIAACALVAALGSLACELPRVPQPRWDAAQRADAEAVLSRIPDGATVAASNRLAPHLTARCRVLLFPRLPDEDLRPDWVVVSLPHSPWPEPVSEQDALLDRLARTDYAVVARTDTVELLHRGRDGEERATSHG